MHSMPSLIQLQRLVGETLGQVCLDPFGVQFKFDRWKLSVEFDFVHVEADGTRHSYDCVSQDGPPLLLHRLLQKSIASVAREDLAFELAFEDGSRLIVRSEIGPYECGQLYDQQNRDDLVVF